MKIYQILNYLKLPVLNKAIFLFFFKPPIAKEENQSLPTEFTDPRNSKY